LTRAAPTLPPLLRGGRRAIFARLVSTGVGQAGLAALTAVMMPRLLQATTGSQRTSSLLILLSGALALGLMRALERLFAEQLSQHYVQQIRLGLIRASLVDGGPSVGITVARTTNDLNSVRNWIALGLTPLAVGVPIILGTTVALALLDPMLALAVVVPMLILLATLAALARSAFARAKQLRRRRGRLAAHVADTVTAAESIRSAGGSRRELRHVDTLGGQVATAAIRRAQVAGYIRGSAAAAATASMVLVAAIGSVYSFSGSTIATALTIVGILVGPVSDLGRVVEYRQSYHAATRILAPALAVGDEHEAAERRRDQLHGHRLPTASDGDRLVHVSGLAIDGRPVAELVAAAGARVVVTSADPRRVTAAIRTMAGLVPGTEGQISVAGSSLLELPAEQRRLFVGHAARDTAVERGTVARAVRYRNPSSEEPVDDVLGDVGLSEVVAKLPERERTVLRRGGEPLSASERARLQLARALYGNPPLLVLDHIDAALGTAGRNILRSCLARYAGVAVIVSDDPAAFVDDYQRWQLDPGEAVPPATLPAIAGDSMARPACRPAASSISGTALP